MAALGVPVRCRLTASSHIVQRACSLPAGEIGVTASGYPLSQVALVIASGHAGDYLPLLAACGQESQDGWPDVKHRRVLRRLSLNLLLFLKCRWQFLLRLEALFFVVTSVCSAGSCQVLFCACQDPLPWECFCGIAGGAAFVCWVWGPLCPSTSAASAVTFGAATAMPAGVGDPPAPAAVPGVPGPMQRQVVFLSSGGRCRSSSGGFDWRDVSQVAVPFACGFFSSAGKFYRSSLVFRGSGPGFSSTHFWSLLHWRRLSVVLPAATVDCCFSGLRAGVCSLLWWWRISARVLMVACLPLLRVRGSAPSPVPWMLIASTGFRSIMAYSRLDFG